LIFKLHITVEEHPTPEQAVAFTDVCTEMLGKCHYIQLANGDFPLQLMISRRSDFNDDATAVKWAQTQAEMVRQLGWHVVRIKVEAPFSAKTYGPKLHAMYTEAHWKFDYPWPGLREWLDKNPELGFKHSWNVIQEGVQYLTARIADKNPMREQAFLDEHGKMLMTAGFQYHKVHYERVVYDSYLGLDHGWDR
jgi:hypothetical protein